MLTVVAAAGAVAAGTALGLGRGALAFPLTVSTLASLVAAAAVRRHRTAALVTVLLALGAGAGASASWRTQGSSAALLPSLAQRRVVVEACGGVRLRRPRSVEIQADVVEASGGTWSTREPLRVGGSRTRSLYPGRRICARGPLSPPRPGRKEAPLLSARDLRPAGTASRIRLAAAGVRREFSEAAQRALPRTQAGLLLGMTDGDVELMDERTTEMFRTTGLAHLVAVSGSNVAVVLVIVMLLSRALIPRGRWLRVLVASPVLVFFAFLTGLEASVLRAVFTAGVALAVTADGRTADAVRISSFAFVALVLTSPELLFHPGFQLSFGATVGLIAWARPLTERIERRLPPGRVWSAAAAAAATTVAAQAAVAPLLAWHFGRLPALGGVANLLVAPLAPVVMVGGSVTLGLASVAPALQWLPATMRLPLDAILLAARRFSEVPAASLGADVVAGLAVTAALATLLAPRGRARVAAATALVAAVAVTAGGAAARGGGLCPGAAAHALDVGQGTAVVLRTGDRSILVDGGPHPGGVVGDLQDVGIDSLDALFVSHGDADHAQGAADVLGRLEVDEVIGPEALPQGEGAEVVRAARRADVPVVVAAAGDSFDFGEELRVDVLWPAPGEVPVIEGEDLNAYSLVLRAHIGDATMLLPGDIGADEGAELVSEDVASPVLVAPHHGSKDLDGGFVEAVAPRLTVVTVGENRYGHPTPEAMEAYARHGSIFRTDEDGRVSICFRDDGVEVVTER